MEDPPEVKMGQEVSLIQVTGSSKISGYVTIPIIFDSDSGPVQLEIKAYVVQDMATPILLGNYFSNQYSISIMRKGPHSYLIFGETGWKTKIENPIGASRTNLTGHSLNNQTLGATLKPHGVPNMVNHVSLLNLLTQTRGFHLLSMDPLSIPPSLFGLSFDLFVAVATTNDAEVFRSSSEDPASSGTVPGNPIDHFGSISSHSISRLEGCHSSHSLNSPCSLVFTVPRSIIHDQIWSNNRGTIEKSIFFDLLFLFSATPLDSHQGSLPRFLGSLLRSLRP
ncbi:hypothetical protein JB92DRAFT_3135688 [Gautieria morchelliformis]|nr:hypothetical protein JB92DRAFT_3135688 [Gautieria morchelliformis]